MSLHRVNSVTVGVPDPIGTAKFYEDFGLTRREMSFATVDGGEQLHLVRRDRRELVAAEFGCDDADDVARTQRQLATLDLVADESSPVAVAAYEPATGVRVRVAVTPRTLQPVTQAPQYNGPGRIERVGARSAVLQRPEQVRPRRLGHFVLGTPDFDASYAFFVAGLGMRVSDRIRDVGAFLRCSDDHHNLLIQRAPVPFLHHTSWQVDDVDEIGRGATAMLAADPDRHVWGLGRHYAGSNFFWYLKDPSGNFAEYHSDMDCIVDDALWTPEDLEGARGLYSWGPPPPASFLHPDDLAELMIAGHSRSSR